ncbi:MAG: hypothetical protein E7324_05755 [Clostridiales bacterium]|nr:hypothetical protein [Clostridiales bacterium]
MKQKLAASIVKFHKPIMILMLLMALLLTPLILKTNINYDLTAYLDEHSMTRRALTVMQEEFGNAQQLRIMIRQDAEAMPALLAQINDLPQVLLAAHDPQTDIQPSQDQPWRLITLTLQDEEGLLPALEAMLAPYEYRIDGAEAENQDIQKRLGAEIPLVMGIALAVIILVLLITSHAWIEPALILALLLVSILINMGTNFLFDSVSFITFAVCAILQMALSIDYGIMLLHSYNAQTDQGMDPRQAMTAALAQTFMPILSSAGTTIAGLLSLSFMSFTIGRDIGMVLSKGILISMLTVFLLLPALILLLHRPLQRTRHRPLQLQGKRLSQGVYRSRKWIALGLTLIVAAGCLLQTQNAYFFTDPGQDTAADDTVKGVFGSFDPLVLMVPLGETDADYDLQRSLCTEIDGIQIEGEKGVLQINAMVTTGAAALEYYTPRTVAEMTGMNEALVQLFFRTQGWGESARADQLLKAAGALAGGNETIRELQNTLALAQQAFHGKHYARILLIPAFSAGDVRTRPLIDGILAAAEKAYGQDFYLTGMAMSGYDIGNAFEGDLLKINGITLLAILLIVALSFRSLKISALLVFVIEGAIWITMGISRLMGQSIFFISYLICLSIQMGATIDYAILLTNHYRRERKALDPRDALTAALEKALPTLLTSGVIMSVAGFLIGQLCSILYISSIGALLARGTVISLLLILTLLPALLLLLDRWLFSQKTKKAAPSVREQPPA